VEASRGRFHPFRYIVRTVFVQKSFRHAALQSSITRQPARFLCTSERVRAARSFIIVIVYRYGRDNITIIVPIKYYRARYALYYTIVYTLGSTSDSGTVRHPRSAHRYRKHPSRTGRISATENVTVDCSSGSGG